VLPGWWLPFDIQQVFSKHKKSENITDIPHKFTDFWIIEDPEYIGVSGLFRNIAAPHTR
jgi:hypothetical protein